MRPIRRRLVATLAAAAVLSAGLWAVAARAAAPDTDPEAATEVIVERIDVNVVNVDVVVTDRDGRLVSGLTRDDFVILEDGEEQPITNFYAIQQGRVLADDGEDWSSIEDGSPFRRRMVLLFDNNFLDKTERRRALRSVHEFLDHKFDETYEWSVVAVGDEVTVVQPFTSEKVTVRAALDRVARLPALGLRNEISREVLNDPVRTRISERAAASRDARLLGPDPTQDLSSALRFESRFNAARNLQAAVRTAQAMIQSFRAYTNLEGNKVLVLVTGGIPMLPEYGYQSSDGESGSGDDGRIAAATSDPQLHQLHRELREVVDAVATEANAAQFKIYSVRSGIDLDQPQLDPQYRSSGTSYNAKAFSAPVERDDNDSAQLTLADSTGGRYLATNRPLESFELIDDETSLYYSLGYTPDHSGDGELHNIRVRVKRPGVQVRSRRSYVDLSDEQRLQRALETPLSFPKDRGTLPVEIEVATGEGGQVVATAVLPMSQVTFFPAGANYQGRIHVYLSVYDRDGRLLDLDRQVQDLTYPAESMDDVRAGPLRYHLRFELPRKHSYTVGMTIVDEVTSRYGTAFQEVTL